MNMLIYQSIHIVLGILIYANHIGAQTSDTIWHDQCGITVDKSDTHYYRITHYDSTSSQYNVTGYYFSGKTQMTDTFTIRDSSIRNGLFVNYYENGIKQSEVVFQEGEVIKSSEWKKNGKLKVEKVPARFPGGKKKLNEFIANNTLYPDKARNKKITGTFTVYFRINAKGKVRHVLVRENIHPLLIKEARRVIKSMPDWIPAEKNGKKVSFETSVAIQFYLE